MNSILEIYSIYLTSRLIMFKIKSFKRKGISCFTLALMLASSTANVRAENTTERNNRSEYGLPTHRRDGGSRGVGDNCIADPQSRNLIALIPEQTVGINASNAPKLFFYVPKTSKERTLEFVLRNEQDELIYEAFLTTEGAGIMSVEIPADIQSNLLEEDQNYHWYLSMICNFKQRSRDIVVEGWMRQETVDIATKQELNTADSIEQAELYRDRGFWYDALSILASKQQSSTESPVVREKWSELLGSVGLEDLAAKPFIESELIEVDSFK